MLIDMVTATINANVRLEVHLSKMKSKVESRGQQRQNYGYMHVSNWHIACTS